MATLMLARRVAWRTAQLARAPLAPSRLLSSSSLPEPYDVVIVGGGPAGLSLAAALGSQTTTGDSLSIALVESSDLENIRRWNTNPTTYSNRVSSITNASRQFLRDIGAWENVDESRTAPIEHMEVWDGISSARIVFSHTDLDADLREMARLTENLNLQRALLRRLDEMQDQVAILDKTKVNGILRKDGASWPVLDLSDGSCIKARLLVGADGFNSPVRKFAGIESYGWAYPTHAIVATLQHDPIPVSPSVTASDPSFAFTRRNTVAYQRFLRTGPIAFLPLSPSGELSSLVWSTTPELAAILKIVRPEVLAALINAAFRLPDLSMRYLNARLPELAEDYGGAEKVALEAVIEEIRFREGSDGIDLSSPLYSSNSIQSADAPGIPPVGSELFPPLVRSIQAGSQAAFPLRLSHVDDYVTDRVALIGDAAHTIHPLAGQGLNMGLSDAKALAETVLQALSIGGDIGGYTNLLPYHQAQYVPNHGILSVTDKLHKLYALESTTAVWARSAGLEVLNELGVVKEALMSAAGATPTPWKMRESGEFDYGASSRDNPSTILWNAAASGIEGFNSTMRFGKVVARGVGSIVGTMAQNVASSLENGKER